MDFTAGMDKAMKELTEHGAFLSVKSGKGINTMTISWGFIGMIWAKPYFIALVRPQRHTKKILETAESFTVSVPYGDVLKNELVVCGTKSGRDINKSEVVEFTASKEVESPVVKGCGKYYECKISMPHGMNGALMPDEIKKQFYNDDFHIMYFGEIVNCYDGFANQK